MVILHNVEQMSRVLKVLSNEGVEITKDILAGLSPYRMAHINRFGDYILDLARKVEPLNFGMKILY